MTTKRITLLYKLTQKEIVPPPARDVSRKDAWIAGLQKTVEADWKPLHIKVTYELFDPEVLQQMRFFNGVCVLYYAMQDLDMTEGEPDSRTIERYREDILDEMLGYDYQAVRKVLRKRKSTADFKSVQAWVNFLNTLEETIFESAGYEFPDSKEFLELEKEHGHEQARGIMIKKLQDRIKKRQAK